ncbi:MAG: hypothetical protein QOK12_3368 [Mycobacterium sp.]|nr:hypothetical protein [Mycobacterium sp.]
MTAITTDAMPAPVRQYFTAMNAFDGPGMVSAFAADAVVNDIQREFLGHQSIQRWADREIVGDDEISRLIILANKPGY